jgi:hypothetical protein
MNRKKHDCINAGELMIKRFFSGLIIVSFLFMAFGCGDQPAPFLSEIIIYPDKVEISDSSPTLNISTQYFRIVLTKEDINGKPLPVNGTEIWITFIWAIPDAIGVVQLYDGDTPVDSPMSVKTDKDGVYNLRVDFQHGEGLEYSGDVEVSSGSAFGSAEFSVDAG